MKRMTKMGFTLVELLCVLVVLALLALMVGKTITKSVNQAKNGVDRKSRSCNYSCFRKMGNR